MKRIKRFFSLIPLLTLWLLFSAFLWGFVFVRVTDTVPAKKLVVCVDAEVPGAVRLAQRLEAGAGENIRMVKVRPFSYAMFSADTLIQADILIVRAADFDLYADWFRPLPEDMVTPDALRVDGVAYGLPMRGAAADCILWGDSDDWYLFFGAESLHLLGNENALDDEARSAAQTILYSLQ